MTRIRLGAEHKALAVLTSLAAGAAVVYGCIPTPDTSGLPPYDAGPPSIFDANFSTPDGGDANVILTEDAGEDASAEETGPGTGTITGVVVDYEQGNGVGVIPGATVSVFGGPTTTTDAFGTFTLKNVTAGTVLLNVSNATDTLNNVAYSSTQVVVSLGADQVASALPVLHEGCVEVVTLPSTGSVDLNDGLIKCPYGSTRTNAYAALSFGPASFTDLAKGGGAFSGQARVEMIPIAFPQTNAIVTDYSWALGLPGQSTPAGLVGAVQIRVYDNGTGDALSVLPGQSVGVTFETSQALSTDAGANEVQLFSYAAATGTWSAVPSAADGGGGPLIPFGGTVVTDGYTFDVGTVPALSTLSGAWLALANPALPTTCVTGTIELPSGAPAPNVLVHGVGSTFFAAATDVTDGNGTFCLDLGTPSGDAGTKPSVEILAGALSGGTAVGAQGVTNLTTSSGSCANASTCTTLGAPIQLGVLSGGCLSGTITAGAAGGCSPLPATLNVDVSGLTVSSSQESAGVRPLAYIGSITPASDGGAFCAPGVPGAGIVLVGPTENPTQLDCQAYLGTTAAIDGGAASCATSGGSACQSVGATQYSAN